MTDEQRAYLELTVRRSPIGSARRIWAAAQLKALAQKPTPTSIPSIPSIDPQIASSTTDNRSYHHTNHQTSREG